MDDEDNHGDAWYVVPEGGGPEHCYTTPFKAHMVLEKLGVAGRIECFSAATTRRELTARRQADGAWVTPQEV